MSEAKKSTVETVESSRAIQLMERGLRDDFPVFDQDMDGKHLIYLDSAASAQKPQVVIDTLHRFYTTGYSNIHRGVYQLSEQVPASTKEPARRCAAFSTRTRRGR